MNAYTMHLASLLTNQTAPRVDIAETGDAYQLTAELPGVTLESLTLQVKDGVLELSAPAERPSEAPSEKTETVWLLRERTSAGFQRSFRLPRDVDSEAIQARFHDGLLELTLPKKAESKPRTIAIQHAA